MALSWIDLTAKKSMSFFLIWKLKKKINLLRMDILILSVCMVFLFKQAWGNSSYNTETRGMRKALTICPKIFLWDNYKS